jgi:hypothetical protein
VLVGNGSIIFFRRTLCVDGKPIVQNKLAVLVGGAKKMK